jgi:putative DNA primase/helicase
VREQVLPIFHGPGANGKSVFLETLAGMMGDYACYAPAGLLVQTGNQEHPTELADLMGRRLVIASETEEGHRLKIQRVKQLTGDIRLKARYMRQDYFEFDQTHKLILVCNNKPIIPESTNAIWRRVKLVPFEVVIPAEERDENLIEKLRAEWPGILNWAIAGCLMWQKEGLDAPEQVREATKEYESEQDVLGAFIEDCCVMSADALVSRADIFAEYQKWVESNHERKILDRNSFYERLRKLPGVSEAMKKFQHKPVRGFTGIGLLARSQQVAG